MNLWKIINLFLHSKMVKSVFKKEKCVTLKLAIS